MKIISLSALLAAPSIADTCVPSMKSPVGRRVDREIAVASDILFFSDFSFSFSLPLSVSRYHACPRSTCVSLTFLLLLLGKSWEN